MGQLKKSERKKRKGLAKMPPKLFGWFKKYAGTRKAHKQEEKAKTFTSKLLKKTR